MLASRWATCALLVQLVVRFCGVASLAVQSASRSASTARVASRSDSEVPSASIKRVIEMMENLIKEMDAEQVKDEQEFEAFQGWCGRQQAATQAGIEELQTLIETLEASLAKLYAQKQELEAEIKRLKGEIKTTKSQIQQAKDKRAEEKASFVKEQQDFASSIKACGKAVQILAAHYGDGTEKKAEKPGFMSFVEVASNLRRSVADLRGEIRPDLLDLLQQPTEFGRFQAKTGEALGIVDQMKVLADTFADDKQSAIDEENRLQKMFDNLMKEKKELLASLIGERDANQQTLNKVNQDIGEQETAKANAESELADEQKYLAAVKKQCEDTAKLFELRSKDRAEEKMAVGEAVKVLGGSAGEEFLFLQVASASRVRTKYCPRCKEAASLLAEAASSMHSTLLASAAAATMGNEAVQDVITALEEMITRIDEDQKMEKAHKEWCESEMSDTAAKQVKHEGRIEELVQEIADTTEVIAEKKAGIEDTNADIAKADKNMEEATGIRAKQKENFDQELENYQESLVALNQAIDVLAKFYNAKKKKAFAQVAARRAVAEEADEAAPREMAPGVFDSVYEEKGGSGVIGMIATVRTEFEHGKADLEAAEKQAIADFEKAKEDYKKLRAALVDTLNRLTVDLQTAENELQQAQEDKADNEKELKEAKEYMKQLKGSCDTLLEHYDGRVQLRKEEKDAIKKAINVLENEA